MQMTPYLNFSGQCEEAFTFWAARFGMVVDRFGVPWLINCEGADAPPAG